MFGNIGSTRIKYYKRLGIYKNSTGNVEFNPTTMEATSYKWWYFVKRINGKVVFNDYNYSVSTSAHQSLVRGVMRDLKIKIDVTVYLSEGLQSFETRSNTVMFDLYESVIDLKVEISRGREGTWAQKSRYESIKYYEKQIENCKLLGLKLTKKDKKTIEQKVFGEEKARLAKKAADKKFVKESLNNTDLFKVA